MCTHACTALSLTVRSRYAHSCMSRSCWARSCLSRSRYARSCMLRSCSVCPSSTLSFQACSRTALSFQARLRLARTEMDRYIRFKRFLLSLLSSCLYRLTTSWEFIARFLTHSLCYRVYIFCIMYIRVRW